MVRMQLAVNYEEGCPPKSVRIGEGLVGYAALHKVPVIVDDVSTDYAEQFIRKNKDRPFSVTIGYKATHGPFTPPPRRSKAGFPGRR